MEKARRVSWNLLGKACNFLLSNYRLKLPNFYRSPKTGDRSFEIDFSSLSADFCLPSNYSLLFEFHSILNLCYVLPVHSGLVFISNGLHWFYNNFVPAIWTNINFTTRAGKTITTVSLQTSFFKSLFTRFTS